MTFILALYFLFICICFRLYQILKLLGLRHPSVQSVNVASNFLSSDEGAPNEIKGMGCRSNFELRDRGGVTDKEVRHNNRSSVTTPPPPPLRKFAMEDYVAKNKPRHTYLCCVTCPHDPGLLLLLQFSNASRPLVPASSSLF